MTDALEEKVARAICLSKQRMGDTDAVAAQYVDTFWRDYLPEARIAVSTLSSGVAKPASSPAGGDVDALRRAAEEFCRRVEAGEVRSKRSYAAFKAALSQSTSAGRVGE